VSKSIYTIEMQEKYVQLATLNMWHVVHTGETTPARKSTPPKSAPSKQVATPKKGKNIPLHLFPWQNNPLGWADVGHAWQVYTLIPLYAGKNKGKGRKQPAKGTKVSIHICMAFAISAQIT
jgi:hypothetical protein